MAEPKKKTYLTMSEKSQILQKIKHGNSRNAILNEYKISERFLRKIVQCADEVINKSNDLEFKTKKTMKSTENAELEAALLKWFIQKRDSGQPISSTMLLEKARIFNAMLDGPPNFKASYGWFSRFKKRHGLKRLSLKRKNFFNDTDSAKEFSELLIEKIIRENLKLENIYNADESGIYWKILLNYAFASLTEKSAEGFKDNKDHFTALFCANASGSHRIPLLIIGKSAKPRDLKNLITGKGKLHDINYLEELDVTYSAETSGWINFEIFKKWYEHEFIPRVLEHQKKTGISGKVLLILDNAPSHPSAEELNEINENFEVMFLPLNVTANIQPMHQSPILTAKKLFTIILIRKLTNEKNFEKMECFLKELKLSDCLMMLSKGWSMVKQSTLKHAWKALLENMGSQKSVVNFSENPMYDEDSLSCETNASVEESSPIYELREHPAKCLSEEDETMSKNVKLKIEEWFDADKEDSGWEILSDKQIVQSVFNGQHSLDDLVSPSMVVDETENIHVKLEREIDEDERIAAKEAHENFLKFKSWMITRVQCSESQILHLKECENILRNAINNNS